ncbi:TPA: hypothetical protein DDW35_10910, partial [Candidatus Sumerlaeota bacterium]|nr:hypothetical protein [Candidatus Sumerlaeota bacterium]
EKVSVLLLHFVIKAEEPDHSRTVAPFRTKDVGWHIFRIEIIVPEGIRSPRGDFVEDGFWPSHRGGVLKREGLLRGGETFAHPTA